MSGTLPASAIAAQFGHRADKPPPVGAALDDLYETQIKPALEPLELKRQWANRWFQASITACLSLAIAGLAVLWILLPQDAPRWSLPFVMVVALCMMPSIAALEQVASKANSATSQAVADALGVQYQASNEVFHHWADFVNLQLVPLSSTNTFTRYYEGQRGASSFAFCYAMAGKYFSGPVFRIKLPAPVKSNIVCLRVDKLDPPRPPRGMQRIGLESTAFNQAFVLFGSDQVGSRELVTPAFMQKLVDLEAAHAGSNIRCAFIGDILLIAMEGTPKIDVGGMGSTLLDPARVARLLRGLQELFGLIDTFEFLSGTVKPASLAASAA